MWELYLKKGPFNESFTYLLSESVLVKGSWVKISKLKKGNIIIGWWSDQDHFKLLQASLFDSKCENVGWLNTWPVPFINKHMCFCLFCCDQMGGMAVFDDISPLRLSVYWIHQIHSNTPEQNKVADLFSDLWKHGGKPVYNCPQTQLSSAWHWTCGISCWKDDRAQRNLSQHAFTYLSALVVRYPGDTLHTPSTTHTHTSLYLYTY